AWTVPAVEMFKGEPRATALVVGDGGRGALATETKRLLDAGRRVIAIDPFYFGEAKVQQRDYLFALLLAAVGDRPLGIQAGQVASAARWARERHPNENVSVVAVGPRSSTFALVA